MSSTIHRSVLIVALLALGPGTALAAPEQEWLQQAIEQRELACAKDSSLIDCLYRLEQLARKDYMQHHKAFQNVLFSMMHEGFETRDAGYLADLMAFKTAGTHTSEELSHWKTELAFRNSQAFLKALERLGKQGGDLMSLGREAGYSYAINVPDKDRFEKQERGFHVLWEHRNDASLVAYFEGFRRGVGKAVSYLKRRQRDDTPKDLDQLLLQVRLVSLECEVLESCQESH